MTSLQRKYTVTYGVSPITTFGRPGYLRRAMDAGAQACRHQPTVADIAGSLHLPTGTVRNRLSATMTKLGARNRSEALHIAEDKGWI